MPRVICDLPNASEEINGVKFHKLEDGRLISDEIDNDLAELFASIAGYELDEEGEEPPKAEEPQAPKLTKAQQKAKEKADAEAAAKAAKEAEEKAAKEAADKEAADAAEAEKAAAEAAAAAAAAGADTKSEEEVF